MNRTCITDSLALDYELFTIANDNRNHRHAVANAKARNSSAAKHIRSQEALSVKKSVEMAAVFADVKLSQTTDVKHISGEMTSSEEERLARNNRRNSMVSVRSQQKPQLQLQQQHHQLKKPNSFYSKSNGNVIPNVLQAAEQNPIFRKNTQKINEMYQTITPKVVGATLEDSLGYLPWTILHYLLTDKYDTIYLNEVRLRMDELRFHHFHTITNIFFPQNVYIIVCLVKRKSSHMQSEIELTLIIIFIYKWRATKWAKSM